MAWGGWGFNPDTVKNEPKKERDEELENILGNLLVAKYQVMRLEDKLTNRVGNGHPNSTFIFRHGEAWYKVSINIDRQLDKKEEEDDTEAKLDQATESTGP